ncbi:MAG TPA: hypothetical protein VFT95_16545 [Micromonosporaceae bacterium]|nr:hypothetical protein [Micromonosporaceae bacterium]
MTVADDGAAVAESLSAWLARLAFTDRTADAVTALVVDAVVAWAGGQGWRVYRRAPSVLPLPPPMSHRQSVLDVACARPDGPPVAIEVDRTDRQRTFDKLLAEARAGRVPIWVRWGTGRFAVPPPPLHRVTVEVARRVGPGGGERLYSLRPGADRPPPAHSGGGAASAAVPLPLPDRCAERADPHSG